MRWKQFFTPVKAFTVDEAKRFITGHPVDGVTLLDVRQPKEYRGGHIPGAVLIPIGDLGNRLDEIPAERPTIVYCAVGGRSRVAAQMLAGKGFAEVYNLSGGFKAWTHEAAVGPEDSGLELFSGLESTADTVTVAYGLEAGLYDFYRSLASQVSGDAARDLFERLAAVEITHQERLLTVYEQATGRHVTREEFETRVLPGAMEGGLTTREYLDRYAPDIEDTTDIVALAMGIEAQALDLYRRAADRAAENATRQVLMDLAREEQAHLAHLAALLDREQ